MENINQDPIWQINQMKNGQTVPDSTDQDSIDEDKRESAEEEVTTKQLLNKIIKNQNIILTFIHNDQNMNIEDIMCKVVDNVEWCKCYCSK